MKKILTYTIALLMGVSAMAQNSTGEIKGKLVDAETKETLPFAHVYVMAGENKIGVVSDIDGNFTLKPLQPGIYNLIATYTGKDTARITGIEVSPDKITFVKDLNMTEGHLMKESVITEWVKPIIDPEDTKIVTVTSKEIAVLPVRTDIARIAKSMSSEITISDDGQQIYFRGSRDGDVIYFVDGVKSTSKPLIPSSAIHNMRIYTGGVPAKYGDMMGGVIMVETKSYFNYYNIWKAQKEMQRLRDEEEAKKAKNTPTLQK